MSDVADYAAVQIELNEQRSIAYASIEARKPIQTSETCLWCNSITKNGARWCNASCRDMWQDYGMQ